VPFFFLFTLLITLLPSLAAAAAQGAKTDLLISAKAAVQQTVRTDGRLFVDVRRPEAFDRLHIPGSLNVPLFAVKTKSFLRGRQVVLVSDGFARSALVKDAGSLRRVGIRAAVLSGGLVAWHAAGGKLEGDLFALEESRRVTAAMFEKERGRSDLLVIDAVDSEQSRALLPETALPEKQVIAAGGKAAPGEVKPSSLAGKTVLVVTEDGRGAEAIGRKLQASDVAAVFYLEGGFFAFEQYRQQAARMADPGAEQWVRVSECKPCREGNDSEQR
jgi:rhodanese-related sulfurtransferase